METEELGGEMAKVENCAACGEVAQCELYHVKGYRDETASNQHVDWVGWLCDACEDKLLAVLDGSGVLMGAHNFIEFGRGAHARDAFERLVDQATWEHGHYSYNGTISTTSLVGRAVKVADEWSDDARELAIAEAEKNGWGEKWESRAIDCGAICDGERMWAFYGWAAC